MRLQSWRWISRGMALAAGAGWLLWLGCEDRGVGVVANLAGLMAVAGGARVLGSWAGGQWGRFWVLRPALVGLAAGAAVGPVAVLLMLIKISLHSHGAPDFTVQDVWAVVQRVPYWMVAGLLGSSGIGMLLLAGQNPEAPLSSN